MSRSGGVGAHPQVGKGHVGTVGKGRRDWGRAVVVDDRAGRRRCDDAFKARRCRGRMISTNFPLARLHGEFNGRRLSPLGVQGSISSLLGGLIDKTFWQRCSPRNPQPSEDLARLNE